MNELELSNLEGFYITSNKEDQNDKIYINMQKNLYVNSLNHEMFKKIFNEKINI